MIYLDHAATTKPLPEVVDAMLPYMREEFGNPSSAYRLGFKAKEAIENSRQIIADYINCLPNEITFTSGGSEANNMVIRSVSRYMVSEYGSTLNLTSGFEHHAVLNSLKSEMKYSRGNAKYSEINQFRDGHVTPEILNRFLNRTTQGTCRFISIMMVNNEIGTVQPIKELAAICKDKDILFHTDAVQAFPHLDIDVRDLGIDYMSVSAHKFGGPKGVGFLYHRIGVPILPLINGGSQENNLRAGTENVAGIVGMATAIKYLQERLYAKNKKIKELSDHFKERLSEIDAELNVSGKDVLPSHLNVWVKGIDNQQLLSMLDEQNIYASAGSACNAGSPEPSYVLKSIGLDDERCNESIRFTLGAENTIEEIDQVIETIKLFRKLL